MKKKTKLPKNIICVAIAALIIGFLTLVCASGQIAFEAAENSECWRPDYEKVDISGVYNKEVLTDEDYSLLYRQTGLTKVGIDRARARGAAGKTRVLQIQDDYFAKHEVKHAKFAPFTCQCYIEEYISHIFLEDGDIVVSSTTNLLGWRMGHSALVTDASAEVILEAEAIGSNSDFGDIYEFTNRITFMILSPKADKNTKAQVVTKAANTLTGIPYSPVAGIFTDKNKIDITQCAHLVWYSYKTFGGIDLDSNGGGVVTPQDMANSPDVDVVQVFGFDPVKLWK